MVLEDEDGLKTVYWADWNSDQLPDVLVGIQWSGTDYWALSEYFQHTVDRDLMRNSQLDTYEDFESKSGEFMVVDWNDDGYEDIVVFEASAAGAQLDLYEFQRGGLRQVLGASKIQTTNWDSEAGWECHC